MLRRQPDIAPRQLGDVTPLLVAKGAHETRWAAAPELAARYALTRRHQRPGGDHGAALDDGAVADAGLHADEAAIFEATSMDQRHVPDRHIGADPHWRLAGRAVDDGAVLNVAVGADDDRRDVAAQHAAEPDTGILADLDIADDDGAGRDEGAGGDAWENAAIGQDERLHRARGTWVA